MNIDPLEISNTTYAVSATIPQTLMKAPALVYWIHVLNKAEKTAESDKYTTGVKPEYSVSGKLELDIMKNRAEGTTAKPSTYFNNAGRPVWGTVSLFDEETLVYTSTPQLFDTGQTEVKLEWKTPRVGQIQTHQIHAKGEFYGNSFESEIANVNTFPDTKTLSLSTPTKLGVLTDKNGNTVAAPAILYSSSKESQNRFRVIAPDGTCVIGGSSTCLVKESTFGERGNFMSITVGDQVFRVRYSGPDNPVERFSITSVDPVVGQWVVELDSKDSLIQQAQAMKNTFLKIKYLPAESPLIG